MAARYDITIEQGSTYQQTFTWKNASGQPMDLTGYRAHMQIRAKVGAPTALLDLSSTAGGITIGELTGKITLEIPYTVTAAILWKQAVYDLRIAGPDDVASRLLEGNVFVSPGVTLT